ncbi:MAG: DNA polymerase III subunit gamma/tau [Ktedonobacteraceae bacterium]
MASQSLYRKWRSQTFSDLVGQKSIVDTLKNQLTSGKLSHAYLFTGPRGTGKTSTARLLAKTLNCTNRKNGEPCNECEQCHEITAGNSFNVIEIDAASNRGIDSIRELREKVMVRPSQGKYKIYILDEAHMLTTEAFNALLKTLEEPPEHAIFVMATTDVHKMLPTVLSRCQRFDFKRITTREIVKHLTFVAEQEQVKLERGAAELVARAAAGGMRDALSLLDQAIAYSGQEISLTKVQTMLGVADPRAIQKFVTHIAHLESAAGLHLIHELAEAGADLRQINAQVAEYVRAIMLHNAGANIAEILDSTEDEIREITQTAQLFSLEELTDHARIFAQNELMQKNQGTPQLGLELALLTCIEHHRVAHTPQTQLPTAAQMLAPVLVQQPVQPQEPRRTIPPLPLARPEPVAQKEEETVSSSPIVVNQSTTPAVNVGAADVLSDWDDVSFSDGDEEAEIVAPLARPTLSLVLPQEKQAESVSGEPVVHENANDLPILTIAEIKEKWELIKRRIKTRKDGSMIAAILNDYTIVSVEGTRDLPIIVLKASAKFHYDTLQKDDRRKAIEWGLKIELGQECQIRLLPPGQLPGTSGLPVPLPPPSPSQDTGGRAANSGILTSSQQSAYRERAVPAPPSVPTPQKLPREQAGDQEPINVASVQKTSPLPPLATMHVVRENTTSDIVLATADTTHTYSDAVVEESRETRLEVLEQKAKTDPVVQEVIRMFKANVKEIQPKQ